MSSAGTYRRYGIEARPAADLLPLPPRFRVQVSKLRLARLVLTELLEFRRNPAVALDRPCIYGVFSGPFGGLTPREALCVGCLRCTVQHPDVVRILPNPARRRLGSQYLKPEDVETILYEAGTGRVPVRGAGYRGPFGGAGWDRMWLDMSEIVRPTRDGIHGREVISTAVDIGEKPSAARIGGDDPATPPRLFSLQVPFVFDVPPRGRPSNRLLDVLAEAARQLETLAIVPIVAAVRRSPPEPHVVPLVDGAGWSHLERLSGAPAMLELDGWDQDRHEELRRRFPATAVCVRVAANADVVALARRGARVLHLVADYRGHSGSGFLGDVARQAHERLVDAGLREEMTLIGSGGVAMAEHVPKAIACGLDAVALDAALWTALQGRLVGRSGADDAELRLPRFGRSWGVQRIVNLAASWRDQLLEVLGAMGLRDVRRLRGELGRCMFQADLEAEAFRGVQGYVTPS